jgi:hypothetical protein
MTLPVGVDELIIPGVLASRDIPVHLTERYLARQGRYVEIRVPASRLEDARRALDYASIDQKISASQPVKPIRNTERPDKRSTPILHCPASNNRHVSLAPEHGITVSLARSFFEGLKLC